MTVRSSSWSRLLAAPSMLPSGVRRSCDSELSSAVRSRSDSISTRACSCACASIVCSNAVAAWLASSCEGFPLCLGQHIVTPSRAAR